MSNSRALVAAMATLAAYAPPPAAADSLCKPQLTLRQTGFSAVRNQQRTWTAALAVDARHCIERSGMFEIKFARLKEFGPDLLFTERFGWSPDVVEISLDFWWDEAVADYWISNIAPCRCAD